MPNYSFLKDILAEIEVYKTENGDYPETTRDFAHWLYANKFSGDAENINLATYGSDNIVKNGGNIKTSISYMFTAMHRFKLHFVKLGLEKENIANYDEISFLFGLVYNGPMTHSRLIEMNIMNKPTRTEIIKRLLNKKLITQTPSLEDKRSKVLTVTPEGTKQFHELIEKMAPFIELTLNMLSTKEIVTLYEIMSRSYKALRDIYDNEKKLTYEEVISKYSHAAFENDGQN